MFFSSIVYGPIHSRRLGNSLGMELMPLNGKLCTFDCIYCECGFNQPLPHPVLPTREEVRTALEAKLQALQKEGAALDVITFSGNGEPTLHPDFYGIITDTRALRDLYCPSAQITVLSNSTQLARPDVVAALHQCDKRILKLDSATDTTLRAIDQPTNAELTVSDLLHLLQPFRNDFILQTCFLRGSHQGRNIDNTTSEELQAWYAAVDYLQPTQVMLYAIDRATPVKTLQKVPREELERIAEPLRRKGYAVTVSA